MKIKNKYLYFFLCGLTFYVTVNLMQFQLGMIFANFPLGCGHDKPFLKVLAPGYDLGCWLGKTNVQK